MIIKFTVTLSPATVDAFTREGVTTGQDIKAVLIEAIQDALDEVNLANEDDEEEES